MKNKHLTISLAGNANVGKSVIFNQLTGLHQHIGNWPGKTVEKAEGTLHFKGYTIDIIDLPGIYSLSTYSIEELVAREYIAIERPDLVINVVDASALERNLFFTLQLMELETPMIVVLNQVDIAEKKGIKTDFNKLQDILGMPVVPTVAIKGVGIYDILDRSIEKIEKNGANPSFTKYGEEVEKRIEQLTLLIKKIGFRFPSRWTAIKLLEGDEQVENEIRKKNPDIISIVEKLTQEIEEIHGHSCTTVITSERYEAAVNIARQVQQIIPEIKPSMSEILHNITTNKLLGYPIMILLVLGLFLTIFTFGNYTSNQLSDLFYSLKPLFESALGTGTVGKLVWGGVIEGIIASVTIALPYIVPFYFILYLLEDSGYLSRIAFLMDSLMHKIGLHGKAFIPAMLGYGCSVPACLGCKIMETERERFLAAFVVTLIPCAARTVIILGLVGAFVGIQWAIVLYIIDLLIIFFLGKLAFKALPGEPTALIMEMSDYRVPHLKTVCKQTWFNLKEFIKISFPMIILGSLAIKSAEIFNLIKPIVNALSPITVTWLGLPTISGIALIFGVLRKELTLVMLATLLGTTNFSQVLTSVQMIIFALVVMLYIPCLATITALVKEFGYRKALFITVFEVVFAIIVGGIALRLFQIASIL